ncbi:MAG: alpha/beta fold hydrolase, partial [Thermoplasmatales archaeon]|nr:alpha/beta fold hydrolase [Thermoplasmatales archaeon]
FCHDNIVTNCTIYNNNDCGIYLGYGEVTNNQFYNNTLTISDEVGIYLDGLGAFNNYVDSSNTVNGYPVLLLSNANNVSIDGFCSVLSSKIKATNFGLLMVHSCDNITVSNCNVSNHEYDGIHVSGDNKNVLIKNCTSWKNSEDGIKLSECSNVNVDNCYVYNNRDGIDIDDSCFNNKILNCTVWNNTENGIYLGYWEGGENNIISGCFITDNEWGIKSQADNNLFYNNYLKNYYGGYLQNAYDQGVNTWNTTKTSGANIVGGPNIGGNYWAGEYSGSDSDNDGLGDTPFNISGGGGNQDHHPLVYPSIAADPSKIYFGCTSTLQKLYVWNDGTGTLTYSVSVVSGNEYFSITPLDGSSTGLLNKSEHNITLNRNNINPGETVYGTIMITSPQADDTPKYVNLSAVEPLPSIAVSTNSIDFGSVSQYRAFRVWNDGICELRYYVSVVSGGNYFEVTPLEGISVSSQDKRTHRVRVDRNKILPGETVTGIIMIYSPDADDGPYYISLIATRPSITLTAENQWDGKTIKLQWESTNGGCVRLFRNSCLIKTLSSCSYVDTVPEPGRNYTYVLKSATGEVTLSNEVKIKAELIVVLVRGYSDNKDYRVDHNYWKNLSKKCCANARDLEDVQKWFTQKGITCWVPPQGKGDGEGLDGFKTIESNAWELKKYINEMRQGDYSNAKINLIGHSMGGLISRKYVHDNPGIVDRIICIQTPHTGSTLAFFSGMRFWVNPASQNLRATFLKVFNNRHRNLGSTKLYSFCSEENIEICSCWK